MVKAFLVAKNIADEQFNKALAHLERLAQRFSLRLTTQEYYGFRLVLVTSKTNRNEAMECQGSFVLGRLAGHSYQWDRFLSVEISPEGVSLENDYAGAVATFYSERDGLLISNIEPCVVKGSSSTLNDLNSEGLYGFMHYSHLIWEETAWCHIEQMLPDTRVHFSNDGKLRSIRCLNSVCVTQDRHAYSDAAVARDLYLLNQELVTRSLSDADEIILPLSSGYDSRMIFAVLATNDSLRRKTRCFTYGSKGSIEVEAGRRLAGRYNVSWEHVELPCKFLERRYLEDIASIFGASVHMHGMYQMEFFEQIKDQFGLSPNAVLTSGFMTGVPAGQHNRLLAIEDDKASLTGAMNKFAQSKFWSEEDLENIPIFSGKGYINAAEKRFRAAFNRLEGGVAQKAILFDVITRQRNFISYYPRTLEWLCAVSSPHMSAEYINFFMSLDEKHLIDRRAVELMFQYHYPDIAKVPSNSNGISAIGSSFENGMLFIARALRRFKMSALLPQRYQLSDFEFNLNAVKKCGDHSFYPFFSANSNVDEFAELLGGGEVLKSMRNRAFDGDLKAYARFLTIQSVAMDLVSMIERRGNL